MQLSGIDSGCRFHQGTTDAPSQYTDWPQTLVAKPTSFLPRNQRGMFQPGPGDYFKADRVLGISQPLFTLIHQEGRNSNTIILIPSYVNK